MTIFLIGKSVLHTDHIIVLLKIRTNFKLYPCAFNKLIKA